MQFPSENRLNGCQIFGWFGFSITGLVFKKPNPNRILVFCTSLMVPMTIVARRCMSNRVMLVKTLVWTAFVL